MGIFDTDLGKLNEALNQLTSSTFEDDPNVWKLTVDKEGNGQALIRFLPSNDNKLFVKVKNHFVKNGGGRMFACMCPKTYSTDIECPVCNTAYKMMNGREWKTISQTEQKKIKNYFSNDSFWSVIQVIKDEAVPENNGKIFKFRYGKKILDKITLVTKDDELEGTLGYNPFHPIEGANFKLIATKVEEWANYDRSAFSSRTPWMNGDKKAMEECYNSNLINLGDLLVPKDQDTEDELNARFTKWVAELNGSRMETKSPRESYKPSMESEAFAEAISNPDTVAGTSSDSGDVDLSYFDSLVEGL